MGRFCHRRCFFSSVQDIRQKSKGQVQQMRVVLCSGDMVVLLLWLLLLVVCGCVVADGKYGKAI